MGRFVYFSRSYVCYQRHCGPPGAQKRRRPQGAVSGSSQAVLPAAAKLNHPRAPLYTSVTGWTLRDGFSGVQPVTLV